MTNASDSLPNDIETLKALILAQRDALLAAEARASAAEAEAKARALLIEQLKFMIAKLRHEQYGQSSERSVLLEQLELKLADLEETASEAEAAAQLAASAAREKNITVQAFERKRPARRPSPCASAARARCRPGAFGLFVLWRDQPAQDRRGCD